MCLDLLDTTRHIASKDIIVYKFVSCKNFINSNIKLKNLNEKSFIGVINGISCEGVLSTNDYGTLYLYTNDSNLNKSGFISDSKFKYSWKFDNFVSSIIVNNIELVNLDNYYTPYRNCVVEIGETYSSKLILEGTRKCAFVDVGIHSFKFKDDAVYDAYSFDTAFKIIKCIIPKGSEYFIGTFYGIPSYASNTLTYLEII